MGVELWTNNARSSLAAGIGSGDTSLSVASGQGSRFPSIGGSDYFWATIDNGSQNEIVKVTARSTDAFTVTRAQQGTTARAWTSGTRIEIRITKSTLEDLQAGSAAATALVETSGPTVLDIADIADGEFLKRDGDTIISDPGGGSGNSTLTSAYSSRPSPSAAGDLFLPTDSFYLERDTGAAWVPWGPIFPMTQPDDSAFSWVNQGSASVVTSKGGIYLSTPGSSSVNLRIRKKSISAPYSVTAFVQISFDDLSGNPIAGLCFRESSSGKIINVGLSWISSKFAWHIGKYSDPNTWSGGNYYDPGNPIAATLGPGVWLRIADDNTNRICSYSVDGQNFRVLHTVGRTDFMTANEVGFFVGSSSNTSQSPALNLLSWKE